MKRKTRTHSEGQAEQEVSLENLMAERRKWARFTLGLACGVVVALAGLLWAIKDWFSPEVRTGDTWTLPLAIIFLAEMAGLLVFSLQELEKVGKQIKQQRREVKGLK